MTELIAAGTAAATSDAFAMSGQGKIIAKLAQGETVTLLEEYPDTNYYPVINEKGLAVMLSHEQSSQVFTGYGNYKVAKSVTAAAVAVGLES